MIMTVIWSRREHSDHSKQSDITLWNMLQSMASWTLTVSIIQLETELQEINQGEQTAKDVILIQNEALYTVNI